MLRSYFMREENSGIRPLGDVRAVGTRKTVVRNTVGREIIVRELLDLVTNYADLRPPVRATLQCIAALGPDFALKEHAYTASGDPDKWKRDRDRRPILDPDAIAEAMGIPSGMYIDPSCGSGSTAYVAEQCGRRWITLRFGTVGRPPLLFQILVAVSQGGTPCFATKSMKSSSGV
jgi:hypothetical protein